MSSEENNQSIVGIVIGLFQTLRSMMREIAGLAVLESRLAVKSLLLIISLFFLVGFFLFSTWVCLLAAFSAWLVTLKLSWWLALIFAALLNIVLIVLMLIVIKIFRRNLAFPATRKQFQAWRRA
jgi:hypothetical protein